jgi:hypothetical protein
MRLRLPLNVIEHFKASGSGQTRIGRVLGRHVGGMIREHCRSSKVGDQKSSYSVANSSKRWGGPAAADRAPAGRARSLGRGAQHSLHMHNIKLTSWFKLRGRRTVKRRGFAFNRSAPGRADG